MFCTNCGKKIDHSQSFCGVCGDGIQPQLAVAGSVGADQESLGISSQNSTRFHGLDLLRGVAMLLGIVIHAALPYYPGMPAEIWPPDRNSSMLLRLIFEFIHSWRMPLFFILSGFFANLVITRKSSISWWQNRFLRLVLPTLVFFPIMGLTIPAIFKYGLSEDFSFFYSNAGQPFHLWFLFHLMIFVLFSILIKGLGLASFKFLNLLKLGVLIYLFNKLKHLLGRFIFDSRFPVLMILIFSIVNLSTGGDLITNIGASGLYFVFGYRLYNNSNLFRFLKSNWKYFLIVGIVFLGLFFVLDFQKPDFEKEDIRWLPWIFLKVGLGVIFSFTFIGLVEDKFGSYNSISRYISDSSYWIYLVHLPIVTFITFFMFRFNFMAEIKFLIATVLTSVICLLTYKYLVRSTVIGILLNGKKLPK